MTDSMVIISFKQNQVDNKTFSLIPGCSDMVNRFEAIQKMEAQAIQITNDLMFIDGVGAQ